MGLVSLRTFEEVGPFPAPDETSDEMDNLSKIGQQQQQQLSQANSIIATLLDASAEFSTNLFNFPGNKLTDYVFSTKMKYFARTA